MSEIFKGFGQIWNRLFDHKGFLNGEINFVLREFEKKRGDREVDTLFTVIENITDIKDTQVERLKQSINQTVPDSVENLSEALQLYKKFTLLEEDYKQDTTLENRRQERKKDWDKFMDNITSTYSDINSNFENKEEDLKNTYFKLEKKIETGNNS